MVVRSLITKIYIYAVCAFGTSAVLAFVLNQGVIEGQRQHVFHQVIADQADFIGQELEQSLVDDHPSGRELARLSTAMHVSLHWVPWARSEDYPAELTLQHAVLVEEGQQRGHRHLQWVRLDSDGKPVGALRIGFREPRGGGPPSSPLALIAIILPGILTIPPLLFWVVRPLRAMVATANRLGVDDLSTPVRIDHRDEFGELQRAFERMRVRIRDMIHQRERLLTDISHELRGPLARLNLALPLLAQTGGEAAIVTIAERELQTMDDLLSEMLTLCRTQSHGEVTANPVDLAALTAAVLEERAIVLGQRQLRVTPELDPVTVNGDGRLLARAIGNLIDNAIKYTPDGGSIHIKTARDKDRARIQVQDDGPGIAAAHLPHIFEAFYRPDDSRSRETGGTGLGLSIVRAIAEAHHGEANLVSTEGQGTTAEIRLPL